MNANVNADVNAAADVDLTETGSFQERDYYHVVDLDRVKEKFAKLTRRAKKLDVEVPGFEVVGEHQEWEIVVRGPYGKPERYWSTGDPKTNRDTTRRYTGAVRIVHHARLVGVREIKLAGWTFAATLDHELGEDNTIVRAVPGVELPKDYRHRGNVCDHCQRSQNRKQTFVCRHDDGRLVQVGSTCIKDFLGHDALNALCAVDIFASARAALEDDFGLGSADPKVFDLTEFLAWTAKAVREGGWLSRGKAYEQGRDGAATADIALNTMLKYRKQSRQA